MPCEALISSAFTLFDLTGTNALRQFHSWQPHSLTAGKCDLSSGKAASHKIVERFYLWIYSNTMPSRQRRGSILWRNGCARGDLDEFVGHDQVVGHATLLGQAIANDRLFSMILWGPPGCGKTTLARIMAGETRSHFVQFSAVLSGVKDIRAVIEKARDQQTLYHRQTVLFVDEIHRFNKAQQDAFLQHVESGLITLIGATTENPSFEVIAPLLSRCRVITLQALSNDDLADHIKNSPWRQGRADLANWRWNLRSEAFDYLVQIADGDARRR